MTERNQANGTSKVDRDCLPKPSDAKSIGMIAKLSGVDLKPYELDKNGVPTNKLTIAQIAKAARTSETTVKLALKAIREGWDDEVMARRRSLYPKKTKPMFKEKYRDPRIGILEKRNMNYCKTIVELADTRDKLTLEKEQDQARIKHLESILKKHHIEF